MNIKGFLTLGHLIDEVTKRLTDFVAQYSERSASKVRSHSLCILN
jgi:hypothetical protein